MNVLNIAFQGILGPSPNNFGSSVLKSGWEIPETTGDGLNIVWELCHTVSAY